MLRKGDEPIPGYRLEKHLGEGNFGTVWRAKASGGTSMALKFIPLSKRRGLRELRAVNTLKEVRHANLMTVTAFWVLDRGGKIVKLPSEDEGHVDWEKFLSTVEPHELVLCMTLGDKNLLERMVECQKAGHAGIPPEELTGYLEDAAKALDYLHAPRHNLGDGPVSITHCDIKPQNIILVGDSAQVCDFGLARVLEDFRQTSMGGSPAYLAPECVTSERPSRSTDQYSLAVSYYELRTGKLPFGDRNSSLDVIRAHVEGTLDLNELPPAERQIIARATSVDPEGRYPTCLEMVRALSAAVRAPAPAAKVSSAPADPRSGYDDLASLKAQLNLPKSNPRDTKAPTETRDVIPPRQTDARGSREEPVRVRETPTSTPARDPRASDPRSSDSRKSDPRASDIRGSDLRGSRAAVKSGGKGAAIAMLLGLFVVIGGVVGALLFLPLGGEHPVADKKEDPATVKQGLLSAPAFALAALGEQRVPAGEPLKFDVKLSAGEAAKVKFRLSSDAPAGATLDEKTGAFTWTPEAKLAAGERKFHVLAIGAEEQELARQTVQVHVDPPKVRIPQPGEKLTNSIGMALAFVPAGEFTMGSPRDEAERADGELQHPVKIAKPFYLGAHEVTQSEFRRVMTANPSHFTLDGAGRKQLSAIDPDKLPVESVTWEEATEFCTRLSAQPAERDAHRRYRLPTEAEWEYACRAGKSTAFHYGMSLAPEQANFDSSQPYGAVASRPALKRTAPTGTFPANPWGLHDMHGNVCEWCSDWYDSEYARHAPAENPPGAADGAFRVLRGGSWQFPARNCRASDRFHAPPAARDFAIGFRVVCEVAANP